MADADQERPAIGVFESILTTWRGAIVMMEDLDMSGIAQPAARRTADRVHDPRGALSCTILPDVAMALDIRRLTPGRYLPSDSPIAPRLCGCHATAE